MRICQSTKKKEVPSVAVNSSILQAQDEEGSEWAVDGCTRSNTKSVQPRQLQPTARVAVRCCSMNGRSCASSRVGCPRSQTFEQAKATCARYQMRLCTKEEMASNICCGTGCMFDNYLVWTSASSSSSSAAAAAASSSKFSTNANANANAGKY